VIGVRVGLPSLFALLLGPVALAQSGNMNLPATVTAGSAFSIPTSGSGSGVLYIVGPDQVIRRSVQLGTAVELSASDLSDAGHYVAALAANGTVDSGQFDVLPAAKAENLNFIAVPSRVPVGQHNGINGTAYVFDTYRNLITTPMPVSFALSGISGAPQSRTAITRNGVAWTSIDSASKQGAAKFVAQAGDATTTRIIQEVPGDPCGLTISARPDGKRISVETAPVRDCSGNPIPDGTIVTITETYKGSLSTVDVPLKKDIAQVDMPAYNGATISVASGVVAGNEIHWNGGH